MRSPHKICLWIIVARNTRQRLVTVWYQGHDLLGNPWNLIGNSPLSPDPPQDLDFSQSDGRGSSSWTFLLCGKETCWRGFEPRHFLNSETWIWLLCTGLTWSISSQSRLKFSCYEIAFERSFVMSWQMRDTSYRPKVSLILKTFCNTRNGVFLTVKNLPSTWMKWV